VADCEQQPTWKYHLKNGTKTELFIDISKSRIVASGEMDPRLPVCAWLPLKNGKR